LVQSAPAGEFSAQLVRLRVFSAGARQFSPGREVRRVDDIGWSRLERRYVAKPLVFRLGETEFAFSLNKIDRSKLYGYKELEVLDEQGRRCELATLAGDGHTVIGRGGSSFAQLTADGEWCDKSELKAVNADGQEIQPVASSFSAPVALAETTTVNDYLQHNIRLVYQLDAESDAAPIREQLAQGAIYKFPYSYRGGLEADAGFLLEAADGNVFLAVGSPTRVEFVGLAEVTVIEEETELDEAELMDFDMI
jgi:hypothetical protein